MFAEKKENGTSHYLLIYPGVRTCGRAFFGTSERWRRPRLPSGCLAQPGGPPQTGPRGGEQGVCLSA